MSRRNRGRRGGWSGFVRKTRQLPPGASITPINPGGGSMVTPPSAPRPDNRRNGPPGNFGGNLPPGRRNSRERGDRSNASLPAPFSPPQEPSQYRQVRPQQPSPYITDVDTRDNWFTPMQPVSPFGPPYVTYPREWDYQVGVNLEYLPRRLEFFSMLRTLTESWGVVRAIINQKQNQILRVPFAFEVQNSTKASNKYTQQLDEFFIKPDKKHVFQHWIRRLLEDLLIIDAPALHNWKSANGQTPYAIEVLDGACYSADTEVLTKRGWMNFAEALPTDEFATRNISTKNFEWQRATYFHSVSYVGKMFRFHSRTLDLLVTPNHRMLVNGLPRKLKGNRWRKGEVVVRAEDLAHNHSGARTIPLTSKWQGKEISHKLIPLDFTPRDRLKQKPSQIQKTCDYCGASFYVHPYRNETAIACSFRCRARLVPNDPGLFEFSGDDYCAFMGMWLSEGSTNVDYIAITQSEKSKGYEPFKKLLIKLLGNEPCRGGGSWIFGSKRLATWLKQFGHALDKFIPDDILNAPPRQIEIFWRYFRLGDGDKSYDQMYTSSPRMAMQLVELAQKRGRSACCYVRKPAIAMVVNENRLIDPANCSDCFVISCHEPETAHFNVSEETYSGKVHCVSVPNEFLYVRRNGRPAWCGNTIKPLVDDAGRRPDYPQPAFQQIIKGLPMINLDESEILYSPMRPRTYLPTYGNSLVEMGFLEVTAGVRRNIYQTSYWTEGNIPDMIVSVPEQWTPTQIAQYQGFFDALLEGNPYLRSKVRFVPGQMKPFFLKGGAAETLKSEWDEWVARIVCAIFGVSPQPFVKQMNRAQAEEETKREKERGNDPELVWFKGAIMDPIVTEWFGYEDIRFVYKQDPETDPVEQATVLSVYVKSGIISINEAREQLGYTPIKGGDENIIETGSGATPITPMLPAPAAGGETATTNPKTPANGSEATNGARQAPKKNPQQAAPVTGESDTHGSGSTAAPSSKIAKISSIPFELRVKLSCAFGIGDSPFLKFDYSSTQFNLPDDLRKFVQSWIDDNISKSILADKENGDDLHVTVKYGLHTRESSDISEVVKGFGPVKLTFGLISVFDAPEYDVLIVKVIGSPELHALNKLICDNLEATDTFPDYKPHMTLAYLKKGEGEEYRGGDFLEGVSFEASQLVFSPAGDDVAKTTINLAKIAERITLKRKIPVKNGEAARALESKINDRFEAMARAAEAAALEAVKKRRMTGV